MIRSAFFAVSLAVASAAGQAVIAQQTPAAAPNNVSAPPETEIYAASITISENGIVVDQPVNVTNHKGYDNQPYFLPGGDVFLYTSEGPGMRMDIWQLDLTTNEKKQLTNTPNNSEYSPKRMPDGSGFSVIYEQENRGGQEVRRYGFTDAQTSEVMLDLSPVGYHAWGQGTRYLASFALGNPSTLRLADRQTGEIAIMDENIGRALYALPDGSGYVYTVQVEGAPFQVKHLDIASRTITPLFNLPGENEHYALMKNSNAPLGVSFVSANGSKLYFRHAVNSGWVEIADFAQQGISTITRLSVNDDGTRIAFVVREGS